MHLTLWEPSAYDMMMNGNMGDAQINMATAPPHACAGEKIQAASGRR